MKPAEIAKRLRALSGRFGVYDVFRDWVESMAYAIANRVDCRSEIQASREAAYMAIVARHGDEAPRVMGAFAELLGGLVSALEDEPSDVLGEVYMLLELGNDRTGQFFTPMSVCDLMAEMTLGDLPPCGFLTMDEPAIGGGAMVIAFARTMRRRGLDPSRQLHATGTDIDRKVLLMAYVQLSLCGIPAVLYVGDTLRMRFHEDWYTPVHVLDGWGPRLAVQHAMERARAALEEVIHEPEPEPDLEPPSAEPEPVSLPASAHVQISMF